MLRKLWNDETGVVITAELVVVSSIVVLGAITGLTTTRNAIITEMADFAAAVGTIDQSFSIGSVQGPNSFTAGTEFIDVQDPGDRFGAPPHPRGIVICSSAFNHNSEGGTVGGGGGGGGFKSGGSGTFGQGGGGPVNPQSTGGGTNPGNPESTT
jgi:hypothetical protein